VEEGFEVVSDEVEDFVIVVKVVGRVSCWKWVGEFVFVVEFELLDGTRNVANVDVDKGVVVPMVDGVCERVVCVVTSRLKVEISSSARTVQLVMRLNTIAFLMYARFDMMRGMF
jgi:hypothetical protein